MALVWVLFAATVLVGSSFVMTTLSMSARNVAENTRRVSEAHHLSTGALNQVLAQLQSQLVVGNQPPANGTVTVDGNPVAFTATELAPPVQSKGNDGLQAFTSTWGVEVRSTVEGTDSVVRTVVDARVVPIFQYALFYENDLHFDWPAPMVISGPVHTNGGAYFSNFLSLKFNTNNFTVAGDVRLWTRYDGVMPGHVPAQQAAVEIRQWVDDPFDASVPIEYAKLEPKVVLDGLGVPNLTGYDTDFTGYDADGDGDYYDTGDWLPFGPGATELFDAPEFYAGTGSGQTLRTSQHGVKRVELPPISSRDLFVADSAGDYTWNGALGEYTPVAPGTGTHSHGPLRASADLVIEVGSTGSWVAYDAGGADVTAAVAPSVTGSTIYDARQAEGSGASMDTLEIDLATLGGTAVFPVDGTVYVAQNGAGTGTDAFGFVFKNGADVPGSFSIISADSVYIQGDFNTVDPKSCAAMADAVNLLSNAWDGTKGPGVLPSGSATDYNLAVLTGEVVADASGSNGGPHNLVRFHEDWSGQACNISGSMVCPGASTRAESPWVLGGDYYKPPNRNWSYDTRFQNLGQLPPGTPNIVRLENVVTW